MGHGGWDCGIVDDPWPPCVCVFEDHYSVYHFSVLAPSFRVVSKGGLVVPENPDDDSLGARDEACIVMRASAGSNPRRQLVRERRKSEKSKQASCVRWYHDGERTRH